MAGEALTNPTLVGQVNLAGSDRALHLKVWSGEVLTQFERTTVMKPLITVRQIASGKSATFPVLGRAKAAFHIPGENIITEGAATPKYLSDIKANERIINVDNLLTSSTILNDLDEAMSHYSVRGPIGAELGRALANKLDKFSIQKMYLNASQASLDAADSEFDPAGTLLTVGALNTAPTGAEWVQMFWDAAEKLDLEDVPDDGRFVIVPVQLYYILINDTAFQPFINRDFVGQGSFAQGAIITVAGFRIIKTPQFPTGVVSAETGDLNTYSGDFTKAMCVFGHSSALGMVQLLDLSLQAEYKIEYQGWLMVARFALGLGTLRPVSSVAAQGNGTGRPW